MSKNILIISSSPRKGGNSDTLCDSFMVGGQEAGNHVEKILLRDKNVHYCTGCNICSRDGKPCPQKDDAASIIDKMVKADVIVLGTPVYFYAMSAQLKTFLDRCCGLYTEMKNKEFYFITAGAEGESERTNLERVFDNLMEFVDCLENPKVKGKILACGVWNMGEIVGHPALNEAYEMGKQIQ